MSVLSNGLHVLAAIRLDRLKCQYIKLFMFSLHGRKEQLEGFFDMGMTKSGH